MIRGAVLFVVLCMAGDVIGEKSRKLQSIYSIRMSGVERQTADYSCGAASLSMLLKHYFDADIDEKSLLLDMTVRLSPEELSGRINEGFSMLDLKESAHRLGYEAEGVILPFEVIPFLKGPVIVLLRNSKVNHFVILKGAADGRVFLADPARGNIRVPAHEFADQWKGEALVLGRENFGLPQDHLLAVRRWSVNMDKEAIRAPTANQLQLKSWP